jgi:hypothetical protein
MLLLSAALLLTPPVGPAARPTPVPASATTGSDSQPATPASTRTTRSDSPARPAAPVPADSPSPAPPSAPSATPPSTGSGSPASPVPSSSPSSPAPSDSPPPAGAPPSPAPSDSPPPAPRDPIFARPYDPPPPPREDRFERGPLKGRTLPTVRAGFGAAFAQRPAPATGRTTGFAFDIALGASIQVREHVFLWPELGYSLALRDQRTGHFVIAGLTPMFGARLAQIGVAPRLVAGDAWGAAGVGVRTGVVAGLIYNLLVIEVGHQWLRAGPQDLHEGRFMLSVDLVTGAVVFAIIGGLARFFRKLG